MAQPTTSSQSHEWWKDKADMAELTAFVASYRSSQREENSAGWRRNVMFAILSIGIPVLLRLLSAI